jgi:hypothetical protein
MVGRSELIRNLGIPRRNREVSFNLPGGWHVLSNHSHRDLEPEKNLSSALIIEEAISDSARKEKEARLMYV